MIPAFQKNDELLRDVAEANPGQGACLWWLGQSGFLIKSADGLALLDPYLSDSLTRKYHHTDKPHVRMTESPLAPLQLPTPQVICSSHCHTDHMDSETLAPLMERHPRPALVIPEANRAVVAERLSCDPLVPLGLIDGQSLRVSGWTVHGIAAAHNSVERDSRQRPIFMGFVLQSRRVTIYHSGDSLWHEQLVQQLSPFSIDVALLPINGSLPTRRVAGNFWGQEAAALAKEIDARVVVPCHYDMFEFNTETPDAFVGKCRQLDQTYAILRCGERLDVMPSNSVPRS